MAEKENNDIYKVEIKGARPPRKFDARWHTSTYDRDKSKVRRKRRRGSSQNSEFSSSENEFSKKKNTTSLGVTIFFISLLIMALVGFGFILKLLLESS